MSTELILRGRIVTGSMDVPDGVVAVDDGVITYAGPASGFSVADAGGAEGAGPDVAERILLPGLVDLHCHGALGSDFSEGSVEGARSAARYLHSRGTTTLLGSLVTGSPEHLVRNLTVLRDLADDGLIAGSHLEGPFLASAQCGAHDPELLLEPDAGLVAE